MTLTVDNPIRVQVGEESVALQGHELDRLLAALEGIDLDGAEAVREQIAALRLVGRVIDLAPTEAELAALRVALRLLAETTEPLSPALLELFDICSPEAEAARG